MKPSIYQIVKNTHYAGSVIRLIHEGGVSYGRLAAIGPSLTTGNEYDYMPAPVLGHDGNLYTLDASFEDGYYTLDLVRWVIEWGGAEPSAGGVVASVTVGALEPNYYNPATAYLIPFAGGAQVLFMPRLSDEKRVIAMWPGQAAEMFDDSDLPRGVRVIGIKFDSSAVLAAGGETI